MIRKELVAASAEPLILALLSESESYGYAILQAIKDRSNGQLQWTDGMLYPVLHRMERKGWIKARRFTNSQNKAAYMYLLTPRGIERKASLTVRFLQAKMQEYELLRAEIKQMQRAARVGAARRNGADRTEDDPR